MDLTSKMAPQQALSRLASWRSWMTTSLWGCNMMEAFPRSYTIPRDQKQEDFPVLVRVTAPPLPRGAARAGVDVVALLDVSKSMEGDKLEQVKKAMETFIGKLGSDDRLSIVSFESNPKCLMGLTDMSEKVAAVARGEIGALKAGGGTDMAAALSAGAEILRGRGAERRGHVGCMIFLSDGDSKEIYNKDINNDYPVHTFGLGGDHNPHVLHHIADKTLGTYSYVNNDVGDIKDAFDQFISDLTSVVAMDVEIAVEAHDGVSISSIRSGGYKIFVDPERRRPGKIYINEMYAGESKCFIVYLTVAEGSQEKLLTLHGVYQQSGAEKQSREKLVAVRRSSTATARVADDGAAAELLVAELTRIKLYDGITKMVEEGEQGKAVLTGDGLQDLWNEVKASSAGVPEAIMSELGNDVAMMMKGIEESKDHRESGLPYMLSWLTSHKWQRATIKDSPSNSTTFKVQRCLGLTTTPWRKTMITWWSRYALSCGWFLLAAVFLYFAVVGAMSLMLGLNSSWWSTATGMVAGNTTLDITHHAGWAKMEEDLHGMLTKAKADDETGSLFHVTTYSERSIHDDIKRYLYMAIVHATMLESRWQLGSVVSGKVVRHEVDKYLRRMSTTVEGIVEIPSFDGASVDDMKHGMTRYLYSTIVQSSNLVAESDGSIPADSKLISDVTNNTTPTPTPTPSPSDDVKSGPGSTADDLSSDHSASTEILIQKKTSSWKQIISWSSSTTSTSSSSVLQTWMSSSMQYAAVLVGSLMGTTARHVSALEKKLEEKDGLVSRMEAEIQNHLHDIEKLKNGQITQPQACECDGDKAAELTACERRVNELEKILAKNGIYITKAAPEEPMTEQIDG